MRRTIATSILTTIACGLLAFSAGVYRDYQEVRAKVIMHEGKVKSIEEKMDQVHWYLIRQRGVKVPDGP